VAREESSEARLQRIQWLVRKAASPDGVRLDEAADHLGLNASRLRKDIDLLLERQDWAPAGHSPQPEFSLDASTLYVQDPGFLGINEDESSELHALIDPIDRDLMAPVPSQEGAVTLAAMLDPEDVIRSKLRQAISTHHVIQIAYMKPGHDAPELRTVRPRHLEQWKNGLWRVYAEIRQPDEVDFEMRVFRTDRMFGVRILDKKFSPAVDFNPSARGAKAPNADGSEPPKIVIRYGAEVAVRLEEQWPSGEYDEQGRYIVRHPDWGTRGEWAVEQVLKWAPEAEVLRPEDQRDYVRQEVEKILRLYQGD
jgi:predicted DNA-binding transcriptional regulator YafY